jgi:alpha(1,3/1,4) fucosyltransferase
MTASSKPIVRIWYVNFFGGFSEARCRSHVLMELTEEFDFVFTAREPDILLVGCYSQTPVGAGRAIKVGYYTENVPPDLVNFDYFFGCEYSHLIQHPKYCKRVFGPPNERLLRGCDDPQGALASKTRFASFIYSSSVPFRERFFRHVSRQREVAAPGLSMHNCDDLSGRSSPDWQAEKQAYLRSFKFTIAFENSRRAGYATEKLYDAFAADTIPVYWGDPELATIVNPEAAIIVDADWERDVLPWLRLPDTRMPYQPFVRAPSLGSRVLGRTNDVLSWLRARLPYSKGFAAAIDEMLALDADNRAYVEKLSQPRLKPKILQIRAEYFDFWRGIIARALTSRA